MDVSVCLIVTSWVLQHKFMKGAVSSWLCILYFWNYSWLHNFSLPFPPSKPSYIPLGVLFQIYDLLKLLLNVYMYVYLYIFVYLYNCIFLNITCSVCIMYVYFQGWPFIWYWVTNQHALPWGRLLSLTQHSIVACSSQSWGEGSWAFLCSFWPTCGCPCSGYV